MRTRGARLIVFLTSISIPTTSPITRSRSRGSRPSRCGSTRSFSFHRRVIRCAGRKRGATSTAWQWGRHPDDQLPGQRRRHLCDRPLVRAGGARLGRRTGAGPGDDHVHRGGEVTKMADEAKVGEDGEEREPDDEQEQQGGGRFNRRLLIVVGAVAVTVAVFAVQGIRSAGSTAQRTSAQPEGEEAGQAVRDKAEVEELQSRAG